MYNLRKDWEKLDEVLKILENGLIDYLTEEEEELLFHLLDKIEISIKDLLSIKELGNYHMNKRGL